MRWVIGVVLVAAFAPSAFAGDFDVLRGPEPTYHWGGFYVGGDIGYSSSVVDLGPGSGPDISYLLRQTTILTDENLSQWSVLGTSHPQNASFGGFAGYNCEWQDLVLGAEVDYMHVSLNASSSGSLTRNFTDSGGLPSGHHYFYTMNISGKASLQMSDIASIRGRIGWQVDRFMPYFFAGMAFSEAQLVNSVAISYTATDYPDSEQPPLTPLNPLAVGPLTQSNSTSAFAYGADLGVGVDAAVLPNVFVRGELEYIYFAPVDGIPVSISSARVGAGFKF